MKTLLTGSCYCCIIYRQETNFSSRYTLENFKFFRVGGCLVEVVVTRIFAALRRRAEDFGF